MEDVLEEKKEYKMSFIEAAQPMIRYYTNLLLVMDKDGRLDDCIKEYRRRVAAGESTENFGIKDYIR